MKNSHILPIVFCGTFWCCAHFLAAQTTLKGRVLNAENREPLGYVSIGIPGTAAGTVAAPDGSFELDVPAAHASDSVFFSFLGFARRAVAAADLSAQNSADVALQPAAFTLREVVISLGPDKKTEVLGEDKTATRMAVNFAINDRTNQNLGSEVGRRFKINKPSVLENFRFFVASNDFDTVRFRINVYELRRGKPGDNLLKDNIFVTLTGRQRGWVDVDLRPFDVRVDEPVVVSVEWVFAAGKGRNLSLPIAMPRPGSKHFYKYGSQARWKGFVSMSAAMLLQIRQ